MENLNQKTRASIIWRGMVLDSISGLEFMMNHYIADYFCDNPEKSNDMVNIVLGDERVNLGAKAQIFYAISRIKHEKWYNSYKSIRLPEKGKKPYSMNSDIVWAIEQRNIFAHRIVSYDMDLDSENVSTQFIQFKNQINSFLYFKADIETLLSVIDNLKDMFYQEK